MGSCNDSHMLPIIIIPNGSLRLWPVTILDPSKTESNYNSRRNRTVYVEQDKFTKRHNIPYLVAVPYSWGTIMIEIKWTLWEVTVFVTKKL